MDQVRRQVEILAEKPPPRAVEAVMRYRVVKIAENPVEQWVVLGSSGDYLVIPMTYCSCPHFIIRVVGQGSTSPCYHLVAVEYAKRTKSYVDLSLYIRPSILVDIILEIVYTGRSKTLRKILYRAGRL